MDATIVKIGLQVAELTKDAKLAADIICCVDVNKKRLGSSDEFSQIDDYENPTSYQSSIPPLTYAKMIKMCIEAGCINSADRILRHSMRSISPSNKVLSNLYSLVLSGYAQSGDLQSTEKMFNEMKEHGLMQRYVKFIVQL